MLQRGYTLLELVIVLAILGLAVVVAIPDMSAGSEKKLALAAQEFAEAIRFARAETIRAGEARGIEIEAGAKKLRVFRSDSTTTPPTAVYDLYHPVSKKLFEIRLDEHAFASSETVGHTAVFRGQCDTAAQVHFDSNGTPWCSDPTDVLLEQLDITLTLASHSRTVTLHGITGRVTIQ